MNKRLKSFPLFLVTIPLFFLLFNHNHYFGLLAWSPPGSDFVAYIAVPIVAMLILNFFLKSVVKTAVVIAWGMMIFYFFEPIHDFLKSSPFPLLGRYFILLPTLMVILIALIVYVRFSRRSFSKLLYFINVLFILLIGYELCRTGFYLVSGNPHDLADRNKRMSNSFKACDTCNMPDIYFLVFDEYTNQKTLLSQFRYQNQPLVDYLHSKGFFVADDSKSNYNQTHLSLGAEMNLNYLPSIYNGKQYHLRDFVQGAYTVNHNELCIMLRKQGYNIANYSIFDIKGSSRHTPGLPEKQFLPIIFKQTLLQKIESDIGWNFRNAEPVKPTLTKEQQKRIDTDMKRFKVAFQGVLDAIHRKDNQPLFTYAHFLIPHRPYYFDSTGGRFPDSLAYEYELENNKGYVHQTVYANKFFIRPLIDSIFARASRPFIIILQGDHGFRGYPEEKQMLACENLNAFYFHDKDYKQLYPQISLVNTFRVVFNKYFRTNFPILKDSSIYLPANLDR